MSEYTFDRYVIDEPADLTQEQIRWFKRLFNLYTQSGVKFCIEVNDIDTPIENKRNENER